ncbi:MAG TPA: glycine oxidase ThiO [Candidatus Dormibacteraeota bacterium]
MRVAVVGGGVIGCAIAERLQGAGHHVILHERDQVGAHASGAAAGLLAPYSEDERDAGARSLRLFPELARRLLELTGIDVQFHDMDSLTPAFDPADEALLKRSGGRWLDAFEVRKLEPGLHPDCRGAALFPESQVTPPLLTRALAAGARAQGAEIREGSTVRSPEDVADADAVVLAAGPWTADLATAFGLEVPVWPSRGQLVRLRPAPGRPQPLTRMLTHRGRYLVPKPDGAIVAGSTEEEAGFDARPTADGVRGLLEFARRTVPALGEATVEEVWAALRPATADGQPIIERAGERVIVATGHNRNGILLAPITAETVAGLLGAG